MRKHTIHTRIHENEEGVAQTTGVREGIRVDSYHALDITADDTIASTH